MGRFLFWGFWERARPLTRNHRRSDSIALTEGLLIAAWQLCPAGLALSVIAPQCHLSQRERLWLTVKFSIIITKWAAHCNEWAAR